MSEPTIPLKHAELLHVAMSTVVHVLESRTNYPVENMESVVEAYRVSRDRHLKTLGYTAEEIKAFTEAATDALVGWLEALEAKKADARADFDKWTKELMEE